MDDVTTLTVSAVVVTMCRPDFVRTCLGHLERQTLAPTETIVVDASPDRRTEELVHDEFPGVTYVRNPLGAGTMATSRELGFRASSGDIVAFLDDDAFAFPDWLAALLVPYEDPQVGAVGGRVLRGEPPEFHPGMEIGRIRDDSSLSGNFDADPGHPIEVEHIQGANMSYRRSVLALLGGIHDGYPGTCLREESDLCCRVRSIGKTIVFAPGAVVDHVAAPYVRGKRFDLRYDYYGQRNHLVFLARNFGYRSPCSAASSG